MDEIYPRLINNYLGPSVVGLVVVGVLAGGISTYNSIGSSFAYIPFLREGMMVFLSARDERRRDPPSSRSI